MSPQAKTNAAPPTAEALHLYRSNRMELLVDELARLVASGAPDPLAAECLVVPSAGLAHWLNLRLSERLGVWANPLYLYPRNFVHWALERVLGQRGQTSSGFDAEQLLWSLFKVLRPLLAGRAFGSARRYVDADPSGLRYFELCSRIAATFDRYITYRPDMLLEWERQSRVDRPQLALFGEAEAEAQWQPILWRALVAELGDGHGGALQKRFVRTLKRSKRLSTLPPRICCLGIANLPPSYLRILVALSRHVPVHVLQLTPSAGPPENSPLLASLGGLARDFEHLLGEECRKQGQPLGRIDLFEAPPSRGGASCQLHDLQRELTSGARPGSILRATADDSISIHVCHSPMREVEVLHDQLLSLLSSGGDLRARDIVVMMPNVEEYAPLIEAVFERPPGDPLRIPYCISDRSVRAAAPVVDALDKLFDLSTSRLSAPDIVDFLTLEVVSSRFEIDRSELGQVAHWLASTNIRWGVDATHKQAHGHPRHENNTWRAGIERLLLGYAFEGQQQTLVCDRLPTSGLEGSRAVLLGKLAEYLEVLFRVVDAMQSPKPMRQWQQEVGRAVEALLVSDSATKWQHEAVHKGLADLSARAEAAGYEEPVAPLALRDLLLSHLDGVRPARGFMTGGVTFCSMVPLRTIPFRILCLLGMSDREFPRREQSVDFDLMTNGPGGPQPGDKNRRAEDRYLFLEALLSARERLLISYTGQSIRDNTELPGSVILSELRDYLAAASGRGADQRLFHPLQAFSERYFDQSDPRLFSYEVHHYRGAEMRRLGPRTLRPLFDAELPPLEPTESVSIAELANFLQNPTAYVLQTRLSLRLRDEAEDLLPREPQKLSPLDRYSCGSHLLTLLLRELDMPRARAVLEATHALPRGTVGHLELRGLAESAIPIAREVLAARKGGELEPLAVEHRLPSGRKLTGSIGGLLPEGLLSHQFSRVRAKHLLRLWVQHLTCCWLWPGSGKPSSTLLGRASNGNSLSRARLSPVASPAAILDELLDLFEQGRRGPIPFFPESSRQLLLAKAAKRKSKSPLQAAEKAFEVELQWDLSLRKVYGAGRRLVEIATEEDFGALAHRIYDPLRSHLQEGW